MTRRATPQPGVDRMVSTSWSGRRWSSPAARQGRALARGLEGRLPLQYHHVSDQNSSSSRCRASFSLALKHGIYRERWIQRYVPEFEKRWNRFACRAGASWRVEETYVKIKGRWTYLYRAVDKEGKTIDFLLRAKRDVAAAKAFFRRAFKSQGRLPRAITLDGYQASHRAAGEILDEHRQG